MNRQQFLTLIAASSLTLSMGIFLEPKLEREGIRASSPASAQTTHRSDRSASSVAIGTGGQVQVNLPDRGAPSSTSGAGSRGDCLAINQELLVAALPDSNLGLTTVPYPTIYVYVPALKNSAESLELSVIKKHQDPAKSKVYEVSFPLPDKPGIVGLSLESLKQSDPPLPALQVGQRYNWYVSVVCDPVERSGNAIVDGWVERIAWDSEKLDPEASLLNAQLYGQKGVWYETIQTMAALRRKEDTAALKASWKNIFEVAGLADISDAEIVDCCQPNEAESYANEQQ